MPTKWTFRSGEARRAIPLVQQLPETCALFERVGFTDDCRREVDRHLAASAFQTRFKVFLIEAKMRFQNRRRFSQSELENLIIGLADAMLYDRQSELRLPFGFNRHLGDGDSVRPHRNSLWERNRARIASGWGPHAGCGARVAGLRLADALDLAELRYENGLEESVYGASFACRDTFKTLWTCDNFWYRLLVPYPGRLPLPELTAAQKCQIERFRVKRNVDGPTDRPTFNSHEDSGYW